VNDEPPKPLPSEHVGDFARSSGGSIDCRCATGFTPNRIRMYVFNRIHRCVISDPLLICAPAPPCIGAHFFRIDPHG
jgi:hypothetical protein